MFISSLLNLVLSAAAATAEVCCNNAFPHAPPPNRGFAIFVFNTTLPQDAFLTDGSDFYRKVLGWSNEHLEEFKQSALYYFQEKFGINAAADPNYNLMLFQTNPKADMRCVVLSGERYIPTRGFTVLDAGWMVMVTNMSGTTLGGEFEGYHAPYGTTFSTGHWLIQRVDSAGTYRTPFLWTNKHAAPGGQATIGTDRTIHGEMIVNSNKWGTGVSLHVAKYEFDEQGNAHAVLRNGITF